MTTGNNLTRAEAHTRAGLLAVSSYDVVLDLTDGSGEKPGETTFRSTATVQFTCREPGATSFIELTAPALHSATLNGRSVEGFDGNRLVLTDLAEDNVLVVDAECAYMRTGEGLHRFVDPVDGGVYLYSQFQTYDAHRMYACFDQPDLKAVFRFTVQAPVDWVVVSNGAVADQPAEGLAGTWTFGSTPRMSTYITAMVAGPYAHVHDEHDGIPLGCLLG